jgi:hypothetical protein
VTRLSTCAVTGQCRLDQRCPLLGSDVCPLASGSRDWDWRDGWPQLLPRPPQPRDAAGRFIRVQYGDEPHLARKKEKKKKRRTA